MPNSRMLKFSSAGNDRRSYPCIVTRWIDADTFEGYVDLGFDNVHFDTFRLVGDQNQPFDAYETRGEERRLGLTAKRWIRKVIPPGTDVMVSTFKIRGRSDPRGKYGRYLATMYASEVKEYNLPHPFHGGMTDTLNVANILSLHGFAKRPTPGYHPTGEKA